MPDSTPLTDLLELDAREERVHEQQIAALYRNAPAGILASFVAAVILVGALSYIDSISWLTAIVFLLAMAVQTAARIVLSRLHPRAGPPRQDWRVWAARFTAGAVISGLIWGLGSLWLMVPDRLDLQLFVILVIAFIGVGAISAFGVYLRAFYGYFLISLTPPIFWSLYQGDSVHYAVAVLLGIWIGVISLMAQRFHDNFTSSLRLRFENLDLVADLRQQKELAEQANIAKSRFLAAASHDLRQPVHALGMFVGALRERQMEQEARRLVDHIDGSVAAMDSLFGSLLDISRLDAGIIHAQPLPFAIQPLLERICREHLDEATRKGIRLALCPSSAVIHSDPILLERILRNLVSNALRYTDHGRVLIGCRRRGRRLSLEVWDTGRGIPWNQQENIFHEFYQLANPERDRTKGLGLGLAIVRRLSALLECPVSLRSEPGKGSVFKVEVTLADATFQVLSQAETLTVDAGRGLILVVDDEIAIQEAMRSLLHSWGYEVIAAGSGDEMLDKIADCRVQPSLIISDYRLRSDENGIALIQRLQSEYNEDIPGILITGDTASDRLKEAQESGFLLLHKPVPNAKLRAAIGNLTAAKEAAER